MYCVDKILLHSDVEVCCVNPGVVDTELFRNHLPEGEPGLRRFCMNCCGTYLHFGSRINVLLSQDFGSHSINVQIFFRKSHDKQNKL